MSPSTTAILVSGGVGSRIGGTIPKQYLSLNGKRIVRYSFDLFLEMPEITEIIVVCAPEYQQVFYAPDATKPIRFALPGIRRQDSVYHGLREASPDAMFALIHDAARPLVTASDVQAVLECAWKEGAAAPGLPLPFTVREAYPDGTVVRPLERSKIWEVQTPQVVSTRLLRLGFLKAEAEKITVTDDLSLVELIGEPVKLVKGNTANLKVTYASDLKVAQALLQTESLVPC